MNKLLDRINVAVQAGNVGEGSEKLMIFCLHSESGKTNMDVIVNCPGGPATMAQTW